MRRRRRRCDSLRRLLQLAQELEPMKYAPPLDELALAFNVNPRTIRRDLELLEEIGYRVPRWRWTRKAA